MIKPDHYYIILHGEDMMEQVKVKVGLENVRKTGDTYSASVKIKFKGSEKVIQLEKLVRRPVEAWASLDNEKLIIELVGPGGEGFASCIIYLDNLERRECRSLMIPSSK